MRSTLQFYFVNFIDWYYLLGCYGPDILEGNITELFTELWRDGDVPITEQAVYLLKYSENGWTALWNFILHLIHHNKLTAEQLTEKMSALHQKYQVRFS